MYEQVYEQVYEQSGEGTWKPIQGLSCCAHHRGV